ncbi:nucleotide disphospho-sugar-binding domain-containing protein [Streptomyces sp. NPDC051041]|uniref:nucleotide disphospho-sugar-binding domain-containing protein n=1 Tax=Streptomyces sp. NPDC051041 TaxID=3365640 RepID=UPI003796D0F1
MLVRPERPRVCVTAGSRVRQDAEIGFLDALTARITALDAEVVVAAPEDVAQRLTARRPGVRAGWLPLDTVLDTCDVLVHSGGGGRRHSQRSAPGCRR